MNEETLSLIWSRRSIRDFERREIEKETVDKLKAMTEFHKENETLDEKRMPACSCPEYRQTEDMKIVGHKSNFRKKLVWFSGIAAILVIGFFAINPFFVDESTNGNVRGEEDVFDITDPTDSVDNDTIASDSITFYHK